MRRRLDLRHSCKKEKAGFRLLFVGRKGDGWLRPAAALLAGSALTAALSLVTGVAPGVTKPACRFHQNLEYKNTIFFHCLNMH
jgi:hypothetical protein